MTIDQAKTTLKKGDVLIVRRCQDKKVRFIFDGWDWKWGNWIVSKTGIADISPHDVLKVNGNPV